MTAEQYQSLSTIPDDSEEGGLELGQIVAALQRRLLIIVGVTTVVSAAAVIQALLDTPTYESSFEILTTPVTVESNIISTTNPEALSGQQDVITTSIDEAQLKILKSPRVLDPIVDTLKARYPQMSYARLFRDLSVEVSRASDNILEVNYQADEPQLVEAVLTTAADAFIQFSLEDRQSDIQRGITFVEEQLPLLRERVDLLQSQLESLRQDYNLIDPQLQGEQLSQQIGSFQQEQIALQVQLDEAQRLYQDLQNQLAQLGPDASASVLADHSRYQSLLDQILDIESQIAQDSALLLDSSPEIQTLLSQRQNLLPLIQQEGGRVQQQVAASIRELDARNQALTDAIEFLNAQIKQLSSVTRQYTDIQRELDIATANLNEFLSKREALRIDAAQRQAPWEVLTQPGQPRASAASAKRNLILGAALGLILGSAIALIVDKLSSLIHSTKDIKEMTGLPLLGVIPNNPALDAVDSLASTPNPASIPFTESFRSLVTNIQLLNPDHPIHSFTVSSATSDEGKSTVVAHLALTATAMGKRVLVVDTDLRRPRLHDFLGLSNEVGLVDLVALDRHFDDVVQSSPRCPNLFFLAAGAPPPDPTTILASQAMQLLADSLRHQFDLIIFDSPPLIGFADPHLSASLTQGLLLIVGLEKIKRKQLQAACDDLKISKIPLLGSVANRALLSSKAFLNYHHYDQPASTPAHLPKSLRLRRSSKPFR